MGPMVDIMYSLTRTCRRHGKVRKGEKGLQVQTKTYLSVDTGLIIVSPCLPVGKASHRIAQSLDRFTAQDLILRTEIFILRCPWFIHWILWQLAEF
jgi:hypothetical protein